MQLYVKRVFIMDDCEALMPEYLRFVKGVVDAHDLSLNVSREILQQDRQIQLIRRRLVKKVLVHRQGRCWTDDAGEVRARSGREFGRAVKEGLLDDPDNREAILEICSFAVHPRRRRADRRCADYVERMKEASRTIYYMTGESRAAIENSPHLEAFRAKGYEVLLLTDPVDEVWVDAVAEFDGKPLRSIAKGQVDLGGDDDDERRAAAEDFAALLDLDGRDRWPTTSRRSGSPHRLTTSPACLVGDADDMTPTLEKMYRAMGQELPQVKRILELNPDHPLVTGLRARPRAAAATTPALAETAELLYGMALLAEGGELADPAAFVALLSRQLESTLR